MGWASVKNHSSASPSTPDLPRFQINSLRPTVPDCFYDPLIERIAEAVVRRLKQEEAPRLMTPEEAARYLHRSKRWVREKVASGELPCVKDGKARPRFDKAALDRYIEET